VSNPYDHHHANGGHCLGASTYNWTLKQSVESFEVTDKSIDQRVPTFLGEIVPERKWSRGGAITEGIGGKRPLGVIPPDLVGNGVGKFEVLRKGTGSDLEIVIRVTVTTETARRGIVEDRCAGEVGACICAVKCHYRRRPAVSKAREKLTQSPVPVRLSSLVAAFGPQREFEIGNVGAVPR